MPAYGPPKAQRHTERLTLGDHDVRAVLGRRPEEPQAHGVGRDDEQRAGGMCRVAPRARAGRDAAEEVRLRDREAGVLLREHERGVRLHLDRDVAAVRVALHDGEPVRVQPVGRDDATAPRDNARHQAGFRQRRRAVVHAGVRDVHARERADQRLELEDRLQRALADLGLVRRVARQELAAHHERIDDRRAEVAVRSGTQEARVVAGDTVVRAERLRLLQQLQLGERVRQIERGVAVFRWNIAEQLRRRPRAHGRQHRCAVVVGQRDVGVLHGRGFSARCADARGRVLRFQRQFRSSPRPGFPAPQCPADRPRSHVSGTNHAAATNAS